jgi:hypothetical protein
MALLLVLVNVLILEAEDQQRQKKMAGRRLTGSWNETVYDFIHFIIPI